MPKSHNYDKPTLKRLYSNAGNLCCMPSCTVKLYAENGASENEIAHIISLNADDVRPNVYGFNEKQLNSYDNLILFCPNHHIEVDDPHNGFIIFYSKE